jgi:transposase
LHLHHDHCPAQERSRHSHIVRIGIAASADSAAVQTARYGVGESAIQRRKSRSVFTDASHTAHRLQTTLTLTLVQNARCGAAS